MNRYLALFLAAALLLSALAGARRVQNLREALDIHAQLRYNDGG